MVVSTRTVLNQVCIIILLQSVVVFIHNKAISHKKLHEIENEQQKKEEREREAQEWEEEEDGIQPSAQNIMNFSMLSFQKCHGKLHFFAKGFPMV